MLPQSNFTSGNQLLIPGNLIKNSNVISHRPSGATGNPTTASAHDTSQNQISSGVTSGAGASSAIQQNRNFEIQTQMLGQQVKLKAAGARTSV